MTDPHALLLDRAGEYADVALANVRREYPRFVPTTPTARSRTCTA